MTTLFGWGPMFDCPSPSPFVMKSDIQLQMLGVDFDRAIADLEAVSKHKAPYVEDDGQIIQDSNFIRAHFEKKLGRRASQCRDGWRALDERIEFPKRPGQLLHGCAGADARNGDPRDAGHHAPDALAVGHRAPFA